MVISDCNESTQNQQIHIKKIYNVNISLQKKYWKKKNISNTIPNIISILKIIRKKKLIKWIM